MGSQNFRVKFWKVFGQPFFIVSVLEIPRLEALVASPGPGSRHELWCEGVKPRFTTHMALESN